MIILLGWELVLSVGAYDHSIPLITCYSRVHSYLLGIDTIPVSLLPVAANDNIYWKMILSTRMITPLSEIVQIRSVLERPIPLLQYPISSWHFLLIVMTTDSMVFHWIWTGINVGNQLWVIRDPLFYLRPVFYLLWLHLSLWLSLLPAHDHCVWYQPLMAVLALGRMVSFINIGHSSYNVFPSDYLSKPSFSLCYIQHHSLY